MAEAYGWPTDLSDEEILGRLVALNQERAAEEARGLVRWMRPEYQVPRFGSAAEKTQLDLVGGGTAVERAAIGAKPSFPADDLGQSVAVTAVLARAGYPLDAAAIAANFRQGRRIAPKVAAVLAALSRMGFASSGDGG